MGKLYRRALLGAKLEVTAGTDSVPTAAANSMLVMDLTCNPLVTEQVDRNFVRPYFGHGGQLVVASHVECNFGVEIAGAGSAGGIPAYGVLMQIAGFGETNNVGISTVYAPVSANLKTASAYYWLDGLLHKSLYTRANVDLALTAKQIPRFNFRAMGLYSAVTDVALPGDYDFSAFQQPLASSTTNTPTVSLHGVSSVPVQSVTIDMGNTIAVRNLIGGESVELTDRKPVGKITMELASVATKDWWASVRAGTTGALQVVHGTTAGNIVQVDASKVYLTNPQYSEQDGIGMVTFDLALATTAGNDEISITVK